MTFEIMLMIVPRSFTRYGYCMARLALLGGGHLGVAKIIAAVTDVNKGFGT